VAVRERDAAGGGELLRTYRTDGNPYACSIVDAARATSAATTFFPPARIPIRHGLSVTYIDGGLGHNNPAQLALDEAEHIWGGVSGSTFAAAGPRLQIECEILGGCRIGQLGSNVERLL
jgi:patatin-like phospholipase/acyl hydrolase